MKRMFLSLALGGMVLTLSGVLHAAACPKEWPALKEFESRHVQADGRVVDFSTPEHITTSEGQSYAMFFALVNNDRQRFKQLLDWTERYLAPGGVHLGLPAWKWGRVRGNQFGMLDSNSASDSDLWIAYNLLEASRLWNVPEYKTKAMALLDLIRKHESADLPGYGPMVLPGSVGFNPRPGVFRMNPSYLPPFLMRRLAELTGDAFWRVQPELSTRLLVNASPKGFAPDWITVTPQGIVPDLEKGRTGSYDAIRTYLWLGITPKGEPVRNLQMQAVYGYMKLANRLGEPLERVDTTTGIWEGAAPAGFYYALEPLATELKSSKLLAAIQSRQRDEKARQYAGLAYYDWVLMLYAKGWMEGRYRFDARGALQVFWKKAC